MDRKPRRAFTLVELLVVIGIIAVLIAVLLPALNRARDQSRTLKCLSNLRVLGQAAMQYSIDNRNHFLPCVIWKDSTSPPSPEEPDYWPHLLVARKYLPRQNIFADASNPRVSNSPLAFDSVLVCPSVMERAAKNELTDGIRRAESFVIEPGRNTRPPQPGLWVDWAYGINGTSYNNSTYNNYYPCTSISYGSVVVEQPLKKRSSIKKSSELAFLFDGKEWNVWYGVIGGTGTSDIIRTRIAGWRHGKWDPKRPDRSGITNVLFMDGHAESLPRERLPDKTASDMGAFTNTTPLVMNQRFPYPKWRVDQ